MENKNKLPWLALIATLFAPMSPKANEARPDDTSKEKIEQKSTSLKQVQFPEWIPVDKDGNFDEKKALQNFEDLKIPEKVSELSDVAAEIRKKGFTKEHQDKIADILFGKDTPMAQQAKKQPLIDAEKDAAFLLSKAKTKNALDVICYAIMVSALTGMAYACTKKEEKPHPSFFMLGLVIAAISGRAFLNEHVELKNFKEHLSRPAVQAQFVKMQKEAYNAYIKQEKFNSTPYMLKKNQQERQ